jgi:Sigma-70, region 4
VREAITALPVDFREVVVLRELEGLSYKEISHLNGIPLGTVMSRLARARRQLYLMLKVRGDIDREFHTIGASPPQPQPRQSTQQVAAVPSAQRVPSAAWDQ